MAIVYDDYYNAAVKNLAGQKNQSLTDLSNLYNSQKNTLTSQYDTALTEAGNAYENQYRENAVQKLINEREVAENMANLGLTDSGLNRTQQTAVQLSYANNKGNIDRQRQSQLDALEAQKAAGLAEVEQNRLAAQDEINRYYTSLAAQNATEAYNTAVQAEQERLKAEYQAKLEALQNAENQKTSQKSADYEYLMKTIESGRVTDYDEIADLIDRYSETYNITLPELYSILTSAGLTKDEYDRRLNNKYKTVYVAPNEYTGSEKVKKWDYKKDGSLNYTFEVVKDTINWFWGVDGNDVVNIKYPDGTLLAKNVKVDELPDNIRKAITNKIKDTGEGNSFKYKANLKGSTF